jgi:hypothetical protein
VSARGILGLCVCAYDVSMALTTRSGRVGKEGFEPSQGACGVCYGSLWPCSGHMVVVTAGRQLKGRRGDVGLTWWYLDRYERMSDATPFGGTKHMCV